jgi:F-type H+-transporting ATPase subunit a
VPRLRTLIILGVLAILLAQVMGLVLIKAHYGEDTLKLILLRGSKPAIEIKAEVLWQIGFLKITNTLLTAWIVVIFLVAFAYRATRRMELIPRGLQNAAEAVIEALLTLVVGTAGERDGRRFFPVIATLFFFIVFANWFALLPIFNAIGKVEQVGPSGSAFREEAVVVKDSGIALIMPGAKQVTIAVDETPCSTLAGGAKSGCLVAQREKAIEAARASNNLTSNEKLGVIAPYLRSMNTDLMSPLSLAIASAIFVEYWGISTLGFAAYGGKFFNVSRLRKGQPMGIIDFFVGVLEFIAEIARLISFTFRLFGNMLAGEILLLVMTFLIPFLLALPFYGLELFVGAIQAFVFAMLTLVFGTLAVSGHGGEEHTAEAYGHSPGEPATHPAP